MFGQTFELFDLPRLLFLLFLELILSADNAIVLGLVVHHLPKKLRERALFVGLVSGLLFRALGLLFFFFLISYSWVRFIAAAYLLYLCFHYFFKEKQTTPPFGTAKGGFWKTVFWVELLDLAFSFDSILAGLGFITSLPSGGPLFHQKLWIVFVGAFLSLILIRFVAKLFTQLISCFPNLKRSAYLIVGWIGIKLILGVLDQVWEVPSSLEKIFEIFYWIVFLGLFLLGFVGKKSRHCG